MGSIGGISRGASIVCAYLIAKKGLTSREAIAYTHSCRKITNPNVGFRLQLARWAAFNGVEQEAQDPGPRLPGLGLLQPYPVGQAVMENIQQMIGGDAEIVKAARLKVSGPDHD